MTKQMYIQPSVNVTEIVMVQTLCASGEGSGRKTISIINPDATTAVQF